MNIDKTVGTGDTHPQGDRPVQNRRSRQQSKFLVRKVLGPRFLSRKAQFVKARGCSHLGSRSIRSISTQPAIRMISFTFQCRSKAGWLIFLWYVADATS